MLTGDLGFRRGVGSGVIHGEVLEVPGSEALDDGVRERIAEAMASAVCTNASRSDDG
jgi:hypothetical protein